MTIKIKSKSPAETTVGAGLSAILTAELDMAVGAAKAKAKALGPFTPGHDGGPLTYGSAPSLTVSPQPYTGDTSYLPDGLLDKDDTYTYTAVKPADYKKGPHTPVKAHPPAPAPQDPGAESKASLKTYQGKAWVMVKHPDGSETTGQEAVDKPKVFAGPPCTVSVSAQFTKNMGNYQSCRLGVEISVPCAHTEIDQVYEFAKDWVDNRLAQALKGVETALKS